MFMWKTNYEQDTSPLHTHTHTRTLEHGSVSDAKINCAQIKNTRTKEPQSNIFNVS